MHCKSCGASIIWVNSEKGRKMPLDLRPISVWCRNNDGTITHVRGHQSHFGTCPNAEAHRKKKNKSVQKKEVKSGNHKSDFKTIG